MIAAAIFLTCAFIVLYVLFLYPLTLRFYPGHPAAEPAVKTPRADWPEVSVVLPVRNGERWIESKLRTLAALDYERSKMQVLVVSDGSTDATESIARSFGGVEVIALPPSGKAEAINAALARATGSILFFTDVRQQLDTAALRELVACFDDPRVGVVSGELVIRSGERMEEENVGLYWKYEKWIRKQHSRIDSVLGATGAIYAMRRRLARPMPAGTLLDDVYLPMGAFFEGYRLLFHASARAYDVPTALDSEFRRKVRTQAGMYQLIGQYPKLLTPANRMWIHFLSHKVGRLALPYALIGLLVSAAFLPAPWAAAAVVPQLAFYAAAALDPLLPESPLKRVTSIARTFSVLMLAALCATSILFRPAGTFWKPAVR